MATISTPYAPVVHKAMSGRLHTGNRVVTPVHMSAGSRTVLARAELLPMAMASKAPPLDDQGRPYFLWSESMTEEAFRQTLEGGHGTELQNLYLGRLLREARVAEVWHYVTPQDIADRWTQVAPHLGRLRAFWLSLMEAWSDAGKISWQP